MYQVHNIYVICGFAAIGGGLFGFDISSMSGVLGTRAYTNYYDVHGGYRQGGITAAMPAGSLVGALCSSFIADRFSRRTAIQVAAIFWIIGSIIQASSNGIPMLVAGRVVAGLSIGVASTIVPIYQAEIAPKEIRGRVISLQQWAITWGILIQYFIQYGASFVDGGPDNVYQGTAAFRIPWGIQTVPAAVLFVGMFFLPLSPRWLAKQDRWEESIQVLADLHGGGDMNHPKVLAQYREIEKALGYEREQARTPWAVLTERKMLRRVFLGMSIQMWSQLSGVNVLMYYIVYVMEAAGIGDPLLAASIQYILNVGLTIPAIVFLDRWGRRPSLLLGAFGMMVLLLVISGLQAAYGEPHYESRGPLAAISWVIKPGNNGVSQAIVACSYLFVCTFAVTWGPTSWTYPSEIFPAQIRAKAVSLATASNWAVNCILAFAVPPVMFSINWKMYIIFAVFNGLAFVHMFLAAPETKGMTLEEMDRVFETSRPPWRSAPPSSRLDALEKAIEAGNIKVVAPVRAFDCDSKTEPTSTHVERLSQS